ncbi:MAG: alpha/beta hydrolase [Chrysiogenetes bacterium]|nr:alpha/beta hydrolase [Chrysiogenetes bacterium]
MQHHKRRTPRPVMRAISGVFQLASKPARERAYRGDYRLLRRMVDAAGSAQVRGVRTRDTIMDGIGVRWFTPTSPRGEATILYCHGGGFCAGSVRSHTALVSRLVQASGRRALAFDYRLAPEHAYPAAIDDAMRVYRHLLEERPGEKVVLAGDSAGGAMVFALAQRIRDEGVPPPVGIVAICPWVDFEIKTPRAAGFEDPGLPIKLMDAFSRHTFVDPATHALDRAGFENLPPVHLSLGGGDTLHAEGKELAKILAEVNPGFHAEVWQDMPHVWQSLHPLLREAMPSIRSMARFIEGL